MFDFLNPKIHSFGIDLSDPSIKIVNLKKEKVGFSLASFGRQEIKEGLIEEGEIKKEAELIEVIRKAVRRVKGEPIKTKYCVASLPETESFVSLIKLPLMKKEEAMEATKWEIEAHIPLPLEEIYYDWQIIEPLNKTEKAENLDVLVGALPKKTVDPYLSVFKKAGLKPLVFEIESIATARALIKDSLSDRPIFILDLGAKRAGLTIFAGQAVCFTTSLPSSNDYLVNILSEKLKIGLEKARQIRFKVGLDYNRQDGPVYRALEPLLNEMAEKIKTYMDFYDEHMPSRLINNEKKEIMICGGGANMNGLPEFLSNKLKIKVGVGNPWINIFQEQMEKVPALPFSESLAYTTALGLALRTYD